MSHPSFLCFFLIWLPLLTFIFTATGKDCAPTSFQIWWVHSVVRVSRWEGLELGFLQWGVLVDCQSSTVEKAVATHSSTLAWQIPWMEEPGRLQSVGFRRVGHDWATSLSLFTFMHWRRKWQPTPVFLPGKSQGPESLVGCCLSGLTELDTTEAT